MTLKGHYLKGKKGPAVIEAWTKTKIGKDYVYSVLWNNQLQMGIEMFRTMARLI